MARVRELWLALILSAGPAAAAQRLAIAPFPGDHKAAVEKELTGALCQRVTCVPGAKVMRGGRPDFKKAHKSGVDAIVTGSVRAGSVHIQVYLSTQPKTAAFDQSFRLSKGHLGKRDLSAVLDAVATSLGGVGPPETPAESTPPIASPPAAYNVESPPAEPAPAPEPADQKFAERQKAQESSEAAATVEASSEPAATEGGLQTPLVLVDVGVWMFGRNFDYNNLSSGPALKYNLAFFAAPRLDLQVYPLAHAMKGAAQRVGLTFDGMYVLGLQSQFGQNPPNLPHSTSLSEFDVGALWWLGSRTVQFAPEVGYQSFNFSTSPDKNGAVLTGLPNVSYGSLRFSGAVRFAATDAFHLEARLSAMPVLSTGQLIGGPYFSHGSGFAFEVDGGARFQLAKNVGLAVLGEYTRYGFSFSSQPSDTYQAQGAVDSIYGGRASMSFNF